MNDKNGISFNSPEEAHAFNMGMKRQKELTAFIYPFVFLLGFTVASVVFMLQ